MEKLMKTEKVGKIIEWANGKKIIRKEARLKKQEELRGGKMKKERKRRAIKIVC